MGRNGPIPFLGMGDTGRQPARRAAFEAILGADYDTMYERAYRDIQQRAVATADRVTAALDSAQTLSTDMPSSALGQQLMTVRD